MFEVSHVHIRFPDLALDNTKHKGNMLHYFPQLYG